MRKLFYFYVLLSLSGSLGIVACTEGEEVVEPIEKEEPKPGLYDFTFYVEDPQGNELLNLDYDGNVLDDGVTLYYNDKTYPLALIAMDSVPDKTLNTPEPGWYNIPTTGPGMIFPDAVWVDGIKVQPIWYGMYTYPEYRGWKEWNGEWYYRRPFLYIGKFPAKERHDKFYLDFGNGVKQEIEFAYGPVEVKEDSIHYEVYMLRHNGKDIRETRTLVIE